MKPGRELDALVAEKVMGFSRREPRTWPDGSLAGAGWRDDENSTFYPDASDMLPHFSSDIAAAWEVVDLLERENYVVSVSQSKKYFKTHQAAVQVQFKPYTDNLHDYAFGESAPHAICLAALKAKGVEVGE